MKQKDKELLLKDLCARLPYGVKVWYKYATWDSQKFATSIRLADEKIALSSKSNKEGEWFPIEDAGEILIKPYLRPMSSMTEEEREYFYDNLRHKYDGKPWDSMGADVDWLNKHHFDYRGLVDKGLALEAQEDMYK